MKRLFEPTWFILTDGDITHQRKFIKSQAELVSEQEKAKTATDGNLYWMPECMEEF